MMSQFVCAYCGAEVPTTPGYEMTAAVRHARDAGHPDAGLRLSRLVRKRAASRRRQRWDALPLHVRGAVALTVLLLAAVLAGWVTDQMKDDQPGHSYEPCTGGFPIRRC
ncbi:hypothetical protein D9753_36135 [Streptomyces dangxiongensis]|uniref:Uncharacterized protein n=1 Tax=Streptomyces dangxiongensis TaxID=1442032 RepID=A0A3G2JPF1_9ACTN|nr:hypothetical protein D9753_36135 [Streptomyces dangxiongensis]